MVASIKFRFPKEEEKQSTITCKEVDGNIFKESCPKYTDTHLENLLKTITKLKVMEQQYNFHNEVKTDFTIQNLGQALDWKATRKWSTLTYAWVTNAAMYKIKVQELFKVLLGEDVEDE